MQPDLYTGGTPCEATGLEQRLQGIGWGCLFILTGVLWLAPEWAPHGTWLAGVGLILLGLNAVRTRHGMKTRGLELLVGLAATTAGTSQLLGAELRFWPMLVIALGMALVCQAIAGAGKSEPVDTTGAGGGR